MSDINVTPLVDVMLVLLVIFIVAAPFMASRLALELPQAQARAMAAPVADVAVAVALDAQGRPHWNDEPVTEDLLRQRLVEAAQRNPATEVQLRADTTVPYGRVVQFIGLAQDAGLSRIGFVADAVPPPAR
ncbi:ExbD/TolR family protein [Hydrogenophaga sp.]|uniref:ExbD/TolR family protein n=1 Tax=Hydrogenophaga sp. TaxID=1904254 RepID=UPI003D10F029